MLRKKKQCVNCFNVLGDPTRARILEAIKRRPLNVRSICALFDLRQPTITHHLQTLYAAGLITRQKHGREVEYSFNKDYPCGKCNIFAIPLQF